MTTLFGTLFNDMLLIRTNRTSGAEIERIKVPLHFGPRDKYLSRLLAEPDLDQPTQITLPRMSFEIVNINYDMGRKQNSMYRVATANNSTRVDSQFMAVPYDFNMDLHVYAKTLDEGNHIVEQILPYFGQDYTVSVNLIPSIGFVKDIPIILNSVTNTAEYEGDVLDPRILTWSLNFTMKGYYFGPVTSPKIVRQAITNIWNDPSLRTGYIITINTDEGNNGTFKLDDTVYQGDYAGDATAYGIVIGWQSSNGTLKISGAQGNWDTNNTVKAVNSNASYNIASFDTTPQKLVEIKIDPDPITANVNSDYGYTTTITEWPNA
jgi:hypothetical protein